LSRLTRSVATIAPGSRFQGKQPAFEFDAAWRRIAPEGAVAFDHPMAWHNDRPGIARHDRPDGSAGSRPTDHRGQLSIRGRSAERYRSAGASDGLSKATQLSVIERNGGHLYPLPLRVAPQEFGRR
jgi:hypothetical protein